MELFSEKNPRLKRKTITFVVNRKKKHGSFTGVEKKRKCKSGKSKTY